MDMTTRIQVAVVHADMVIVAILQHLLSIVLGLVLIWLTCKIVKGVFHGIESRRSN